MYIRQHKGLQLGKEIPGFSCTNFFHFVMSIQGTNIKLLHFHLLFSRVPLADYHDAKHSTRSMYLDLTKGRLLTCGGDRIVKVRNVELLANNN